MGQLFQRGLSQTVVLRKQWALGILYKRVDSIKSHKRLSFHYWFLGPLETIHKKKDKRISLTGDGLERSSVMDGFFYGFCLNKQPCLWWTKKLQSFKGFLLN